ncbi:MAG: hypothetical protein GPJ54_03205 [Candidatus Heimdallarchaeota archaeon]|nr:hypothetical protein [Candidatus Heimdallarchaeota archaeon]
MGNRSDNATNVMGIILVVVLLILYVPDYINISDINQPPPIFFETPSGTGTTYTCDAGTSYGMANSNIALAQTTFVTTNFELSFLIRSGSRIDESYALYIKQALAPLSIDVKIWAKPWGQFVGDLKNSTLNGKPFDLTTTGFNNRGKIPELSWLYHSDGYWGDRLMHFDDPAFQAWQLAEIGLNQTSDIYPLVKSIDYELNLTRRYEMLEEFNELYFTRLLWNMPLVAQSTKMSMWKGFGGVNNELWGPQEGIISSSFLGAKWDPAHTASQRVANSSTIRWAVGDQRQFNLDPFQSFDDQQDSQTDWSYRGQLLSFDKNYSPHPNVAWNWFSGDFGDTWDNDNNAFTPDVALTQYTFLLRDDVYWHETQDFEGNVIPAQRVDGLDYNLSLTLYDMARQNNNFEIEDENHWNTIADWSISSTVFPHDTVTIRVPNYLRTPNDSFKFGNLNPLPEHLLGGDLIFYNSTSELNETAPLTPGMPFDPWDTYQWNSFESFEGNTAIGPYQMVDYDFNIFHSFAARSDYWYPNEWDISAYHTTNIADPDLLALETIYNVDLELWGGSNSLSQDAYYHSWNGTNPDFHDKPTALTIEFIEYVVIDDHNWELIKFEAGDLDIYRSTTLGASTVAAHTENPDLAIKDAFPSESASMLFFNLLNDHLKKINVRLAIAHVIDREKLVNIHDGFGRAWWSVADPATISSDIDWDPIQHPLDYDYPCARYLMKLEGYRAADSNDFIPTADIPDVTYITVQTTASDVIEWSNNFLKYRDYFGISTVIALVAVIIRKGIIKYN